MLLKTQRQRALNLSHFLSHKLFEVNPTQVKCNYKQFFPVFPSVT